MHAASEYARLINSVRVRQFCDGTSSFLIVSKLAYASRVRSFNTWQSADARAQQVRANHEKARRQGRIPNDRLGILLAEIADAERRAHESKHDFDEVSKLLRSELLRFEQERVEDFKDALELFLDGMIRRQKEVRYLTSVTHLFICCRQFRRGKVTKTYC